MRVWTGSNKDAIINIRFPARENGLSEIGPTLDHSPKKQLARTHSAKSNFFHSMVLYLKKVATPPSGCELDLQ